MKHNISEVFKENTLPPEKLEQEVEEAMGDMTDEELFEAYDGEIEEFRPGNIIEGTIAKIFDDSVAVDIGYKSEGVVPMIEFASRKEVEVGKTIHVFIVMMEGPNGSVVLSKKKADLAFGWKKILNKYDVGDITTGKAIRKIKGGLLVDIGVPVFMPASQIDIRRRPDIASYIGEELECKLIKIDEEQKNIVVSRRRIIEEEREEAKEKLLEEIEKGEVREGVVKNITDFGAFIDLGGIDGLLHITDMSWSRVSHPSEIVAIDEKVEVVILDFDKERERISLGLKQKTPNPWEGIRDKYPDNAIVPGEVVNILPYGAFVKLEDGVEGLVHISEMSWTKRVKHPSEIVDIGDRVNVMILNINEEKQEISLGMKQTEKNPWEVVKEKYPPGSVIRGKVRNLTSYGAFIEVEEGVDGLLHVSDMSWTKKVAHPKEMVRKGDMVDVKILEVDEEKKRVSLGMKQLEENPWDSDIPDKYQEGLVVQGTISKMTNFGAFVELEPELEGLLHISEVAARKIDHIEDVLEQGQSVNVRILELDSNEKKIRLSLRNVEGNEEVEQKLEELEETAGQEEAESEEAASDTESDDEQAPDDAQEDSEEQAEEAAAEEKAPEDEKQEEDTSEQDEEPEDEPDDESDSATDEEDEEEQTAEEQESVEEPEDEKPAVEADEAEAEEEQKETAEQDTEDSGEKDEEEEDSDDNATETDEDKEEEKAEADTDEEDTEKDE